MKRGENYSLARPRRIIYGDKEEQKCTPESSNNSARKGGGCGFFSKYNSRLTLVWCGWGRPLINQLLLSVINIKWRNKI